MSGMPAAALPVTGSASTEEGELRNTECRRCQSSRLLILEKKREEDNDVYRCRDCGYLFSPPQGESRSS